jgi:hypothetical protein
MTRTLWAMTRMLWAMTRMPRAPSFIQFAGILKVKRVSSSVELTSI